MVLIMKWDILYFEIGFNVDVFDNICGIKEEN